jgi:hypothetical protein
MSRTSLDEKALRRPDFVPGSPVTLADGQIWFLRRPVMRFVPNDDHESGFDVRLSLDGDTLYNDLMARRVAAFGETGFADLASLVPVELAIGKLLLLVNYDLTPAQLADLLQFGYDADEDPEGMAIRDDVIAVAQGRGKKPSPAGDVAPPSPPGG